MMGSMSGMMGAGWLTMGLTSVLFLAAVVAVVVWLARDVGTSATRSPDRQGPAAPSHPATNPDEILAQRFARGEINEDDYLRRRAVLQDTPRGIP
jgi:putative membrane protein